MSPLMYCGLLDDFAVNHGIGHPIKSVSGLNSHLIHSVLFGDPLAVNDGHVLMNEAVQTAVLNPKKSPFRRLVENGYVQILSRNARSLGTLADFMAEQKVVSAQRLLDDPYYANSLKPALTSWSAELSKLIPCNPFLDWPSIQTNYVYRDVATKALDSLKEAEPRHLADFTRFEHALGDQIKSRTGWEETVKALRRENGLAPAPARLLIHTANEAYNYMWGCLLTTTSSAARIQTSPPRLLGWMDQPVGDLATHPRNQIELFVPDGAFADRAVADRWSRLDAFSNSQHDVSRAKADFISTLTCYYTTGEISHVQMKEAAKAYSKALSQHFGHSGAVATGVGLVIGALGIAGGIAFAGAPAIAIAVGTWVVGPAVATKWVRKKLLWRVAAPNPHGWIEEQRSATASWFELNKNAAHQAVKDAPVFVPPSS